MRASAALALALALAACGDPKGDDGWPERPASSATGTTETTAVTSGTTTGATATTPSDTGDTGSGTTTTPPAAPAACLVAAAAPGGLDGLQIPGNGMVIFCHAQAGGAFLLVNQPVMDCMTHIGHPSDVFPTTICDG